MILDGRGRNGTSFEADVCVVGAGAAGLTLALELERLGKSVLLVESGGLEFSEESHALLDVELGEGSPEGLVKGTRERFFGGTTNHWGSTCIPLGDLEFEHQPWMADSGWPIQRNDLAPYYTAAAKLLELRAVDRVYDPARAGLQDYPQLISESELHVQSVPRPFAPGRKRFFGQWMRKSVQQSQRLTCLLNTTIAELYTDRAGERVEQLEGRTFGGDKLTFKAGKFVLCTGAIENPRLLMLSDSVVPGGLGNSYDLVGRYFMDHFAKPMGVVFTTDPSRPISQEEGFIQKRKPVGMVLTEESRRGLGLQGFIAMPTLSQVAEVPYEGAAKRLFRAPAASRIESPWPPSYTWLCNYEQSPNPASRVLLSDKRDALGIRKPHLDWQLLPQDIRSANRAAELISRAITRSGFKRLTTSDLALPPVTYGGGHQMGSTRMSNDPRRGVTDRNCRVHSVANLYIGGSGVFPTGGWQNPTLTIMAMALRLAEHLASS